MHRESTRYKGAMHAILGLPIAEVDDLVAKFNPKAWYRWPTTTASFRLSSPVHRNRSKKSHAGRPKGGQVLTAEGQRRLAQRTHKRRRARVQRSSIPNCFSPLKNPSSLTLRRYLHRQMRSKTSWDNSCAARLNGMIAWAS